MIPQPKKKWRPTLSMIVLAVLTVVMTLPVAGLFFFRLFENQLVRETERELIAQSAVLSAAYLQAYRSQQDGTVPTGAILAEEFWPDPNEPLRPIVPGLDLATDAVLLPRPDARLLSRSSHPAYRAIGKSLTPLIRTTQSSTLAGFRILDPFGTVIAGREDVGQSLSHVREVEKALTGRYASSLRQRLTDEPTPPIHSISRGTGIRTFVAMPVLDENRVIGVIYASRTPDNILRQLYQQRYKVAFAAIFVTGVTLIIGFIFTRAINGPIYELIRRTELLGKGDKSAIQPLDHHGSRELAVLSQSFLSMSETIFERAEYIQGFASHVSHELKSPLTSIQGAAELLQHSGTSMSQTEREKFLTNILGDTERLTILLDRLRTLALADNPILDGYTNVEDVVKDLIHHYPDMDIRLEGEVAVRLAMAKDNAEIVFNNLIDNARKHDASCITITVGNDADGVVIDIEDNGSGISPGNAEKVFDLFFTTRRDEGGTGMGLGIVQSMLKSHKGSIHLKPTDKGAHFVIGLPAT
ncbi:MAG: ATP-binding protein [Stappiaceae bacterium]